MNAPCEPPPCSARSMAIGCGRVVLGLGMGPEANPKRHTGCVTRSSAAPVPPLLDDPADQPLWRLLLDPRGRIARSTWWLWGVAVPLGTGLLLHALLGIARVRAETAEHIVNLLLLWPTLAVSINAGTTATTAVGGC